MASSNTRARNFSEEQKLYLIELAKGNNAIEQKDYGSASLRRKADAWSCIMSGFNAKYPGQADLTGLKGLWKRIKEKTKKDLDKQRKDSRATGGGRPECKLDAVSEGATAVLGDSILPL